LKLVEKAGWKAPADHPDVVPAAEAGHLADLMRVLKADHDVLKHPPEFGQWLQASEDQASELEKALVAENADAKLLSANFAAVTQSCKTCHVKYRD
jgi:cytochrome c556